jgi:hypothetical protein
MTDCDLGNCALLLIEHNGHGTAGLACAKELPISDDPSKGLDLHIDFAINIVRPT